MTATCTQDGSIEYWTCSGCNRNFSDEQLTQEVSSTTAVATGHDYDADDKCTKCQQAILVLTLGNNKVNIYKAVGARDQITGYNLFKYTPKEDGTLEVTASSGNDTYGTLWGSRTDSNPLTSDDSGNGNDFKFTYTVTKGSTYYIGARHYSGRAIDDDVTLNVKMNGLDVELPEGMSGIGSEENPFVLRTAEHLARFRDFVNAGKFDICAKIADDAEDIDMSTICHAANAGNSAIELSWEPIGNDACTYEGTFDGNGKIISNLYVKTGQQGAGLFGSTNKSTIKNLTIENAYVANTESYTGILLGYAGYGNTLQNIKISTTCQVIGNNATGGIAGRFEGYANNCANYANVKGAENVGGLFGHYVCTGNYMTACANYGDVAATNRNAGGLVGYFKSGTLKNCANYGDVTSVSRTGGIASFVEKGKIQNVFSYGNVSATSGNVGLVFGESYSGSTEGLVAYYSGAKLTINGQEKEARAFGNDNLSEEKAARYTQEQIASGEVAWLLNGSTSAPAEGGTLYWYQKLGDNADAYPVLTTTGDNTVYHAYQHGKTNQFYSNDVNSHKLAYNAEAEDEANGNHDVSYVGEYTWTDAEDKAQDPTVAVTFTCKVCGNAVTPQQMTVEHDADHDNEAATCTEEGHNYYKTSYTFNDKAVFSDAYTQTLPALGHVMPKEEVFFNEEKKIYMNYCQRNCDYYEYYITSDGSIKAMPYGEHENLFTLGSLSLDDATLYDTKARYDVRNFTYNRTFENDRWQALYVPFDLKCFQIAEDYEVATINNFHEYEQTDGSIKLVLEVKVTQKTIPALTPCVIRKKKAPETRTVESLVFEDVQFEPSANKTYDCASVARYYQFTGMLHAKDGFNVNQDFLMNGGILYKAEADAQLSPQRWYLSATDRSGNSSVVEQLARVKSISINVVGEDDTTGIEDIYVTTDIEGVQSSRHGIYDLQGRKLSKEPSSGVYIKDGKKYVK